MVQNATTYGLKVLAVMSLPLLVGLCVGIPTAVIREVLLIMIGIGMSAPCAYLGLKTILFTSMLYMGVMREGDNPDDVGQKVYNQRMERVLHTISATGNLPPGGRLLLLFVLGEVTYALTILAGLCYNIYLVWMSA